MLTDPRKLEKPLKALPIPSSLPMALPCAHITKARWFSRIVERGYYIFEIPVGINYVAEKVLPEKQSRKCPWL
jgi:hypothetical protein